LEPGYPSPFDFARDGRIEVFDDEPLVEALESPAGEQATETEAVALIPVDTTEAQAEPPVAKRRRAPRRKPVSAEPLEDTAQAEAPTALDMVEIVAPAAPEAEAKAKPRRTRKPKAVAEPVPEPVAGEPAAAALPASDADATAPSQEPEPDSPLEPPAQLPEAAHEEPAASEPEQPRKTGWWRRLVS
jgi:hypothetical protein